ncbi:MAG: gfo/Idh/MocA family oxidoreductase [Candidatus Melainabacteria bacterium]|nr:MAG: gfo/Idh/MocA family oxidoreductase [Candidatus Melainabacteria bacterium]
MTLKNKVRFAVAGLGHIAQIAVLPAFKHASEKCELTALISNDSEKIEDLSRKYDIDRAWSYDQFDEALSCGCFDALYIALPNDMHKAFAIRAANAGVHVLCEKPMAVTPGDAGEMIEAARRNRVKLMVAYRLHFEKANMTAVDLIQKGEIGQARLFNSSFTMQVKEGNIRMQAERGGGPLHDIGIYCINAARYLFQAEPIEAMAITAKSADPRFIEIEECCGAVLRFPDEKIANFYCSFGAADVQWYEVIGSEGSIYLEPSYAYDRESELTVRNDGQEERHKFPKRDQFAPELLHFAECILENKEPRPSGEEGLNDLKVIKAIQESAASGKLVAIESHSRSSKPNRELVIEKPPVITPHLINAESGSR